jgi:hypothetical protein
MNTGFGRTKYEYAWPSNTGTVIAGFHFKPTHGLGGAFAGDSEFFQWRTVPNSGGPQKQVTAAIRSDGRLEFWKGGTSNFSGTLIHSTAAGVFTDSTWCHLELKVSSGQGVWAKKNGVYIVNEPTLPTTQGDHFFTHAGYCWESFGFNGYTIDNYYLLDGASGLSDFLGECRVTTQWPNADIEYGDWVPNTPPPSPPYVYGSDRVSRVFERYTYPFTVTNWPDGDTSYIELPAGHTSALYFRFNRFLPAGTVLGTQVAATLRSLGVADMIFKGILRQDTDTNLSDQLYGPQDSTYWTKAAPVTSLTFDEQDFADGRWTFGMQPLTNPGGTRLTQLVVERLHLAGQGAGSLCEVR